MGLAISEVSPGFWSLRYSRLPETLIIHDHPSYNVVVVVDQSADISRVLFRLNIGRIRLVTLICVLFILARSMYVQHAMVERPWMATGHLWMLQLGIEGKWGHWEGTSKSSQYLLVIDRQYCIGWGTNNTWQQWLRNVKGNQANTPPAGKKSWQRLVWKLKQWRVSCPDHRRGAGWSTFKL